MTWVMYVLFAGSHIPVLSVFTWSLGHVIFIYHLFGWSCIPILTRFIWSLELMFPSYAICFGWLCISFLTVFIHDLRSSYYLHVWAASADYEFTQSMLFSMNLYHPCIFIIHGLFAFPYIFPLCLYGYVSLWPL